MIFYDEIGIESLDFDDFDSAILKELIGLLHCGKFDHASGPAGHKVASIKRGKVSRTNKDLELFEKKNVEQKWSISLKFSTSLKESHECSDIRQHLVGSRQNLGPRGLKLQQFWVTYMNKNTKKKNTNLKSFKGAIWVNLSKVFYNFQKLEDATPCCVYHLFASGAALANVRYLPCDTWSSKSPEKVIPLVRAIPKKMAEKSTQNDPKLQYSPEICSYVKPLNLKKSHCREAISLDLLCCKKQQKKPWFLPIEQLRLSPQRSQEAHVLSASSDQLFQVITWGWIDLSREGFNCWVFSQRTAKQFGCFSSKAPTKWCLCLFFCLFCLLACLLACLFLCLFVFFAYVSLWAKAQLISFSFKSSNVFYKFWACIFIIASMRHYHRHVLDQLLIDRRFDFLPHKVLETWDTWNLPFKRVYILSKYPL